MPCQIGDIGLTNYERGYCRAGRVSARTAPFGRAQNLGRIAQFVSVPRFSHKGCPEHAQLDGIRIEKSLQRLAMLGHIEALHLVFPGNPERYEDADQLEQA
jgi:hypothetical protein